MVLHASVCLCMDFEQEQKFAEPYVIHPELKRPIRYPRRAGYLMAEQVASAGWAAQFEAACHLVHFHHLQHLQNEMEARPRRLKVHILAPATKLDA